MSGSKGTFGLMGRMVRWAVAGRGRRGRGSGPVGMGRILRGDAVGRWMLPQLAAITPTYIENILRGALGGNHVQQWELFDLMEDTWPRLVKNLNQLKGAVKKMDWKIAAWAEEDRPPSSSAEERARLVSAAVWGMRPRAEEDEVGFEGLIYDLLDAWAKGVSVVELDWEVRGARANLGEREPGGGTRPTGEMVAPRAGWFAHPCNYGWSEEGWLGLVVDGGGALGQTRPTYGGRVERFPEDKFLVGVCKARSGHPLGAGLLRALAWWWCAANFSADWLLNFAQIFGLPIRWAEYDKDQPGLLDKVADMLENMGSQAWAAFPAGTKLSLVEAGKGGTGTIPQGDLLDRADKQCDLLILRQTLTSEVGQSGSRALGDVHEEVLEEVKQEAADWVAGVINLQLVPSILRLNYGDDEEAPEFCPEPRKGEDAKANAERDGVLLDRGVAMPKEWFYKRHGIPLPGPSEEVVEVVRMAGPDGRDRSDTSDQSDQGTARSARRALPLMAKGKATERLVDNVLEELTGVEARWLGGVKPFFRGLIAKAQNGDVSDEDFVRALERAVKEMPELFAKLDGDAVAVALEGAMGAACVNGAVKGFMERRGA